MLGGEDLQKLIPHHPHQQSDSTESLPTKGFMQSEIFGGDTQPKYHNHKGEKEMKISITKAIELAEESHRRWEELEKQGKAFYWAESTRKVINELKAFKEEFERNKNNESYCCKTASDYVNLLQSQLCDVLGVKNISDEARWKINDTFLKLRALFFLLKGIEIES